MKSHQIIKQNANFDVCTSNIAIKLHMWVLIVHNQLLTLLSRFQLITHSTFNSLHIVFLSYCIDPDGTTKNTYSQIGKLVFQRKIWSSAFFTILNSQTLILVDILQHFNHKPLWSTHSCHDCIRIFIFVVFLFSFSFWLTFMWIEKLPTTR